MDLPEKLDVAIIGAGLSGICALIRVRQAFADANVIVPEKAAEVGGTWAKSTYPGLSYDIPSQPAPSTLLCVESPVVNYLRLATEILRYIRRVVFDYGCEDHSRTKQEFTGAKWLEEDLLWRILVRDTASGKDYVCHTRFLITAVGFCEQTQRGRRHPRAEEFQGPYSPQCSLGTLARFAGHGRSGHRKRMLGEPIHTPSGTQGVHQALDTSRSKRALDCAKGKPAGAWLAATVRRCPGPFFSYVPTHLSVSRTFSRYPILNRLSRIWLAASLDLGFIAFQTSLIGKLVRGAVQRSLRTYMQRTAPARYHDILIPDFDFEAKRPVLGHGYLTVLHDPKVELVKSQALKVVGPNSIASDDGRIFQADVIVLANGFKTQELLTPMEIVGRDDAELPRSWKEEHCFTSAYMGVSIHGFPNLFLLTGPNTPPSGHSTLVGIECSVEYIIRLLKKLLGELSAPNNASLGLRADAQKAFNDRLQTRMNGLVYSAHASLRGSEFGDGARLQTGQPGTFHYGKAWVDSFPASEPSQFSCVFLIDIQSPDM